MHCDTLLDLPAIVKMSWNKCSCLITKKYRCALNTVCHSLNKTYLFTSNYAFFRRQGTTQQKKGII